jgi:2-hydroxy-4-carboxymuconate semialdehyde hemiacetal dehydrogenase
MRVAIIGCGAVAGIHAARLRDAEIKIAAVCGSTLAKAQRFAGAYGVERAAGDINSALDSAEAAIVASPSPLHYRHALRALERGLHVLVELPPCASIEEAESLGRTAARSNAVIQCAHTSRFLEPYRRIGSWIREGGIGEMRQAHYFRSVVPSPRSWTDDALLHHAAHPLDLFLDWFAHLEPLGCAATPRTAPHQDVSLLGRLPNGAPATIAISYSARRQQARMTLIGDEDTVVVEGFSSIESDRSALLWHGDATTVYEQAIGDQDLEFLRCCESGTGGVPWSETLRLVRYTEAFQRLCMTEE